ncbi:endonuclease/exonuclease/phosphatase family protein [Paenibacillus sp. TAB 01]|uniref:endonuclease/exonuclease/phosphatase family protein n=1 Tax=Paenibacillus sp. TAB 01 TaxID=3368988 RepID=UPI00375057F4
MKCTVMTFNLRYDNPNDGADAWPHRVDNVAETIREHSPLVVGTQEGYLAMLTALDEQLDGYTWIGQGRFGGHENEHCAIFYKEHELELRDHGQFWLSETPEEAASKSWDSMFPRVCTWAHFIHHETGKAFLVYNTHLDHYAQAARDHGSKVIWKRIVSHKEEFGLPVVLLGDFNSTPGDLPIRFLRGETAFEGHQTWLKDAYAALPGAIGLTAHSFQGGSDGEPIDYIFVSPDVEVLSTAVERRHFGGRYPSDHYPIVSRVSL